MKRASFGIDVNLPMVDAVSAWIRSQYCKATESDAQVTRASTEPVEAKDFKGFYATAPASNFGWVRFRKIQRRLARHFSSDLGRARRTHLGQVTVPVRLCTVERQQLSSPTQPLQSQSLVRC